MIANLPCTSACGPTCSQSWAQGWCSTLDPCYVAGYQSTCISAAPSLPLPTPVPFTTILNVPTGSGRRPSAAPNGIDTAAPVLALTPASSFSPSDRPTNSPRLSPPANCASPLSDYPTGLNCDTYQCVQSLYNCPASGEGSYPLALGEHYCKEFLELQHLSVEGTAWRDQTILCLQSALKPYLIENGGSACVAISSLAIGSHSKCFLNSGISVCDLPWTDWVQLSAVLDASVCSDLSMGLQIADQASIIVKSCYSGKGKQLSLIDDPSVTYPNQVHSILADLRALVGPTVMLTLTGISQGSTIIHLDVRSNSSSVVDVAVDFIKGDALSGTSDRNYSYVPGYGFIDDVSETTTPSPTWPSQTASPIQSSSTVTRPWLVWGVTYIPIFIITIIG